MKILFVGLDYYIYTRAIIAEMRAMGADVTFVDIMPRSLPHLVMRTLQPESFARFLGAHHWAIVEQARVRRYDKIVFLQAHQMALDMLAALREVQPQATFILYNWDAISNHDYRTQAQYFDRILTFDPADALACGYEYLPLFCVRSLQNLRRDAATPRSLYMVGNIVKPQRYEAVEAFRAYTLEHGITFRQHLKITPVVLAQFWRSGLRPRGLTLRSVSDDPLCRLIESSVAAFDFANHSQSGQTMRMMENLCAGKKVVTNSQWVCHEPFYSPDRIHVFSGTDYAGVAEFLETPLVHPDARFEGYYIQSFVSTLLDSA